MKAKPPSKPKTHLQKTPKPSQQGSQGFRWRRHSFDCGRLCHSPTWPDQGPNAASRRNPCSEPEPPISPPSSSFPHDVAFGSWIHPRASSASPHRGGEGGSDRRWRAYRPTRRRVRFVLGRVCHDPPADTLFDDPNGTVRYSEKEMVGTLIRRDGVELRSLSRTCYGLGIHHPMTQTHSLPLLSNGTLCLCLCFWVIGCVCVCVSGFVFLGHWMCLCLSRKK